MIKEHIGPFDKTILDALSAHIAILDTNGMIIETNRAWKYFGSANGLEMNPERTHMNYLDVCDTTTGKDATYSFKAAEGIRHVINKTLDEFTMEYPCHSPVKKMWFYLRVTPIFDKHPLSVFVSHENITSLKLAEEAVRSKEEELQVKARNLEETNTALKVLLNQREMDKEELEKKVITNIDQLITPFIEKLKLTRLDDRQKTYMDILESHLNDISSPLLHKISTLNLRLTPQEIKVAGLVKAGRSTKEIADVLSISVNAVDFHRKHIRDKLGLKNTRTNLQSFLMSLK